MKIMHTDINIYQYLLLRAEWGLETGWIGNNDIALNYDALLKSWLTVFIKLSRSIFSFDFILCCLILD